MSKYTLHQTQLQCLEIIIHLYQYPMLLLAMTKSNTKSSIYIIYEFMYQTHTYIQTLYDNVKVFD